MALYEHIFMARQDISHQEVEEIGSQMSKIIADHGGKICKNEYWGLRPLAYIIKKNSKAHYTLFNIDASADALREMERQLALRDDVIRFLSIAVDEHETGPSAPMRSKDREHDSDASTARHEAATPAKPQPVDTAPSAGTSDKPADRVAPSTEGQADAKTDTAQADAPKVSDSEIAKKEISPKSASGDDARAADGETKA